MLTVNAVSKKNLLLMIIRCMLENFKNYSEILIFKRLSSTTKLNIMNKIILTLAFIIGSFTITLAQKVNDKVQINSNGSWYPGKILKVNSEEKTYFVTYDGWGDSWNEWVTVDRLKDFSNETAPSPLTKFKVGDKVEVEYGMIPVPATIIEVGENKYHIQFDKKAFGDKWVAEGAIKKL